MVFNWFKRLFCVFLDFGVTTINAPNMVSMQQSDSNPEHCPSIEDSIEMTSTI